MAYLVVQVRFDFNLYIVFGLFSDRKWKIDVGYEHSQICELIDLNHAQPLSELSVD